MKKKNYLIIFIILIILVMSITTINLKKSKNKEKDPSKDLEYIYEPDKTIMYTDTSDDEKNYKITMFYKKSEMIVEIQNICHSQECEQNSDNYQTTLTKDEKNNIGKLLEKYDEKQSEYRDVIISIASLGKNIKEKTNKEASDYNKDEDIDNDGIITYREFGNYTIAKLLKSKK